MTVRSSLGFVATISQFILSHPRSTHTGGVPLTTLLFSAPWLKTGVNDHMELFLTVPRLPVCRVRRVQIQSSLGRLNLTGSENYFLSRC